MLILSRDRPALGLPLLSLFYSLNHKHRNFRTQSVTSQPQDFSHPLFLITLTSRRHLQTSSSAWRWEAMIIWITWAPDPQCLLMSGAWAPGCRGVLEPCSRLAASVRTIFSANRVDVLTLDISFPGAEAMSLWKLLKPLPVALSLRPPTVRSH